jgi:hypothetical protein
MLAHKVQEKNSQIWRRFDIQEGMNSHTAELCDGQDPKHLQGLSEPEGEKGSDTVVERPCLITIALMKGHQMAGNFMDRCLKFRCGMEAVKALHKEAFKGLSEMAKQSKHLFLH